MQEIITLNLGPILGFLFTIATVAFIAWGAPRTHREGALEALQEGVYQVDGGAEALPVAPAEVPPPQPQGEPPVDGPTEAPPPAQG